MEGKSSTQRGAFFLRLLAKCSGESPVRMALTLKVVYHQPLTNLPKNATDIVRFLKYVQNLGFCYLKSRAF